MSDQDPFEPPASDLGSEPEPDGGSVGWGIFLAILIMIGGGLVCGGLTAIPFISPLRGALGCLVNPLLLLGGVPLAALIARGRGKTKTAKGLWIGYALVLGFLLLMAGLILWACSGMKL